nr:hypothetical protein [Agromyces protaetiae]
MLVEGHGHGFGAEEVEEVEERREPGVLDDDAVAEAHDLFEGARDRVERAVDDDQAVGDDGPGCREHVPQGGEHGFGLIAAGLGAGRDARERGPEGGQEQRVRRAA